jgi:D-3-phosphoglycerate dehydrogenase
VGVDNVDFAAASELGLPVANTPGVFGAEVADVAVGYTIALARELFATDRGVRAGGWPKPAGISLGGRVAALVGYGNIGQAIARRLRACDVRLAIYDPAAPVSEDAGTEVRRWPDGLGDADFLILSCALNATNHHLVDDGVLAACRHGVRIVNVSRGLLIEESALERALASGQVHSVALDVFEIEPLPLSSALRSHPRCIFGSHNASNTVDAVRRATEKAVGTLINLLDASPTSPSSAGTSA